MDRKFERDYYIDPRVQELQKNAESAYVQWKREQERLREEQMRERTIRESLARVKGEKEQLHRSMKGSERQPEMVSQNEYKVYQFGRRLLLNVCSLLHLELMVLIVSMLNWNLTKGTKVMFD